jgi:sugar phosphate isomerase/epimerase
MMDRREFVATLLANAASAGGLLASAGLGAACSSPRSSDAASGQVGNERMQHVGVQLYTVRAALARDFDGTLARIAAIGYRNVEFAGYAGRRAEAVSAVLDRLGLSAPSAHVPLDTLRNNWRATVDAAHVIDHHFIVVPWLDEKDRRTIADYERLAQTLNRLGRMAREADLKLAYHNHDFELVPLGGRVPYDVLLSNTDPELVSFQIDLYWTTKAGADPLAYFDRFPGRFTMLHLKDSAGPPQHTIVPVGSGSIQFPRILARWKDAEIEYAFVEHDNPTDPFASIKSSYDYLSRLTI